MHRLLVEIGRQLTEANHRPRAEATEKSQPVVGRAEPHEGETILGGAPVLVALAHQRAFVRRVRFPLSRDRHCGDHVETAIAAN